MEWNKDIEEDDLGLLSNEIEDLEDDEVSLREAAFINGYNESDQDSIHRVTDLDDPFAEEEEDDYE
ncbi:hypothetical protein HYU11_06700 [Candidatus Woesearchaeota archaeon]|nr:hypothetical protein [Candidatus Woesearchaeota archaeon]